MKVPKSFVPKKPKELDLEELKKPKGQDKLLEDLVAHEGYLGCDHKKIYDNPLPSEDLDNRGINAKSLRKTLVVQYDSGSITVFQYKSKNALKNNLRQIFEKSSVFYNPRFGATFFGRFLFKNNFAIFVEGGYLFIPRAVKHYRQKGFKQLDYELKAV